MIYKRTALAHGTSSKRDIALSQVAFYGGARGVLKVLDHLLEHGDDDELRRTIQRQGRQIKAIQARRPQARRH
jgi:hypothetical protein